MGAAGDVDPTFTTSAADSVYTTPVQPDGRIILTGEFLSVNGTGRNRMARLNSDGTLDSSFSPNANNIVRGAVLQPDGKILLGGEVTSVGSTVRNHFARVNANGSVDSGFNPNAGSNVYSMVLLPDGKILAGGLYNTMGGVTRNNLARVDAGGTLDTSFTLGTSSPSSGVVRCIALQPDGKALIGGLFNAAGGYVRYNMARINKDGTLDIPFQPVLSSTVFSIAIRPDGRILIGGVFNALNDQTRPCLAQLLPDGSPDPSFNTVTDGNVYSIALQTDGKAVISGIFNTAGGVPRSRIARLNADGSLDTAFNPGASGDVRGVTLQADGRILAGGEFTSIGGQARTRIARLLNDSATQSLTVPDPSRIQWLRGGSSPETTQVTFELSTDGGAVWTPMGNGTRISGGWELTGLNLPPLSQVRGRARVSGGYSNFGSGLVESTAAVGSLTRLQAWRFLYFGNAGNTGNAADNADPDGDGVSNLVEYAFDLDPTFPDAPLLPSWQADGAGYVLDFLKPEGVEGITYVAEYNTGLEPDGWLPVPDTAEAAGAHTFRFETEDLSRAFLRCRIVTP